MHYQGRELISRGTKVTSRTLLTSSFALLLVVYAGSPENTHAVLGGLKFQIEKLSTAGSAMVFFLLVSHVVSWWGDKLSYSRWNVSEKTGSKMIDTQGVMLGKIDEALEAVRGLRGMSDKLSKRMEDDDPIKFNASELTQLVKQSQHTEDLMIGIKGGIDNLNRFAWSALYLWYGAVPVLIALFAISTNLFDCAAFSPEAKSN